MRDQKLEEEVVKVMEVEVGGIDAAGVNLLSLSSFLSLSINKLLLNAFNLRSFWFDSRSLGFSILFKHYLTDLSVSLPHSIWLSKLPIIGFCSSNLEMSLKTILNDSANASHFCQ